MEVWHISERSKLVKLNELCKKCFSMYLVPQRKHYVLAELTLETNNSCTLQQLLLFVLFLEYL